MVWTADTHHFISCADKSGNSSEGFVLALVDKDVRWG
jgi:hypothetical protein